MLDSKQCNIKTCQNFNCPVMLKPPPLARNQNSPLNVILLDKLSYKMIVTQYKSITNLKLKVKLFCYKKKIKKLYYKQHFLPLPTRAHMVNQQTKL